MIDFAYLIEPPFNDRESSGIVTGCDVELARTILAIAGMSDVNRIETEFAQLLPGLVDGRWRMTTGLFATGERRRRAAFSRPIWALPDGLLVRKNNPKRFTGYRSVADTHDGVLAVIRDQFQHRSAVKFGIREDRILIFETYTDAAQAVLDGRADAYASVARAHSAFVEQSGRVDLAVVTVGIDEKEPAFGSFAFKTSDDDFRRVVDDALLGYLGSREHRKMAQGFGFTDADIDLITG